MFEQRVTLAMVASEEFLQGVEPHWCDALAPSPEMMRVCHWALKFHQAHGQAPRQQIEEVYHRARPSMPRAEAELIADLMREVLQRGGDWDAAEADIATDHLLTDTRRWLDMRASRYRRGSLDRPDERKQLTSIKEAIWRDITLHLPSRLAWYMTEMSSRSKKAYSKRETMMAMTLATSDEIDRALRTIRDGDKWHLFRWSRKDHAYLRMLKPNETAQQFRDRVRRTVHAAVGIAWILRDLLEIVTEDGIILFRGSAPHSNEEFAKQLGCHPMTASRELDRVLKLGLFKRYNRRIRPIYARFDDDDMNTWLADRYEEDKRTEYAKGVNPYIEPTTDGTNPSK